MDGSVIWLAGIAVAALLLAAWWVRNADHRDARQRNGLNAKHREALDKMYGDEQ